MLHRNLSLLVAEFDLPYEDESSQSDNYISFLEDSHRNNWLAQFFCCTHKGCAQPCPVTDHDNSIWLDTRASSYVWWCDWRKSSVSERVQGPECRVNLCPAFIDLLGWRTRRQLQLILKPMLIRDTCIEICWSVVNMTENTSVLSLFYLHVAVLQNEQVVAVLSKSCPNSHKRKRCECVFPELFKMQNECKGKLRLRTCCVRPGMCLLPFTRAMKC